MGIYDANEKLLFNIERCACYCECMHVGFEILTPDGEETGKKISKLYAGALKEMFTTNDNFLCEFPDGIDIPTKVLFICASMMIEFTHFENKGRNGSSNLDYGKSYFSVMRSCVILLKTTRCRE